MDIEGFVRARIDDYSYDDLAEILAVRIREYKKINEENSIEMAKAVIDEVATTLKLNESDDEFLKEIASVNKADVLMGEMGVGSRGAGDFFVHRKIAKTTKCGEIFRKITTRFRWKSVEISRIINGREI